MIDPELDAPAGTPTVNVMPASNGRRRGFALPLTIMVLAVLTVALAAGFAGTTTEILTNNAQRSEARAFALAENGLQEFIALRAQGGTRQTWCALCGSPPTVKYESTTVNLPGGYAEVVAQRVMKNVGVTRTAVYLIRSRGVDTVTPLIGSLNGAAKKIRSERIVAQYAYWDMKVINIVSGWTSLSGLTINGNSSHIEGNDNCGVNPTVAGVATPTSGLSDPHNIATGNPPHLDLGSLATAAANTKIDWLGLTTETAVTPDLSLVPDGSGNLTLPANYFADPTKWPIIHVKNMNPVTHVSTVSAKLPTGRGMIIIDGDANFSGGGTWNGIILAGGSLTSNGGNNVYGAVVTGLNVKLGYTVGQDDAGNGTKFYQYDSCAVAAATAGIGHYRLYPNAWLDNFTTY